MNGFFLNYFEKGERSLPAILFSHAFPLNHKMWTGQIERFSKHFRVVSYDIRGFGASPLGETSCSMEQYASDLIALMDFLKIEKAVLAGLSMGGYIVLNTKILYPKRVSALILSDTRVEADSPEGKQKREEAIVKLKTKNLTEFADGFLKGALSEKTHKENPVLVNELKETILSSSIEGMCAALTAMKNRKEASDALRHDPIPTLVLVGEKDTITPPEAAEKMASLSSKSHLYKIKNAGHLSNVENPNEFNEYLASFLKK